MYMVLPFFFIYIEYAAISPYLPLLVRDLGYSPAVLGILLGVFEGVGILGPFIFGHFADKWGRYKPGLIITHVLVLISAIPLALFINPLISALLLVVMALGFRSSMPLLEAVTTINIGNTGDYGKIRTAGSISFILMMLFLQGVPFLRPQVPFNIAIWISITTILALIAMSIIPSKYTNTSRQGTGVPQRDLPGSRHIWTPLLILGLTMISLNRLAMTSVNTFFSLFLVESMHWNAVGFMWALASASEVPFMFLSKPLIARFGALRIMAVSTAAVSLRLAIYALFPIKAGVIPAQLLHSLCFGLFHPAAIAFISSCIPPERRALGMSLYLAFGTGLPTFIGNILGGFIVEHLGYQSLFGSFAVFPVIAIGIYGFIVLYRKKTVLLDREVRL
jgi:PPP family 3-phenylpropionic acid transporter